MSAVISTRHRIRDLNDAFRSSGSSASGQWFLTRGIQAKGADFLAAAFRAVREFDAFTPDNDPHGEHDFGSISLAGEKLLWKIDYYDQSLSYGSDDPSDPAVTRRVITVMLASEY